MNLTPEIIESAKHGAAVRFTSDDVELVLLRADFYDRVQALYDDSEWSEDEMEALASQMFEQLDDPEEIHGQ
jgi:hypothetical protein